MLSKAPRLLVCVCLLTLH